MTSAIDATKPVFGTPTTQSVRSNFATAASEITALQNATGLLPPEAPSDGYPYQRFDGGWQRTAALYPQMFGAVPGGADATAALQAGLDAAYNQGLDFVVAGGAYSVTGLKISAGQTLRFAPGGSLKMTATGACLSTQNAPGAGVTASVKGICLDKPVIDMNLNPGAAILLEGAWFAEVRQPKITDLASPGTFPWTDAYGAGTLPNAAIILKGIASGGAGGADNAGIGCHYNKISVVDIEKSTTGGGGYGIWLGTSPGASTMMPHFNQIYGGMISTCLAGVYVSSGDDNTFEALDVSVNTTGFAVGLDGVRVYRTRIVKPYCENCTTGVHIGINSDRAILEGTASFANTTTPVLEDPGGLYHATQYLNFDTNIGGGQLVPYDFQSGGMWHICSGAGGVATTALAHASYGQPNFQMIRINGTPAAKTPILSGQTLGTLALAGYDGASLGAITAGPALSWFADENWSATAHGAHLTINVIAPGTLTRQGEVIVRSTGTFLLHGAGFYGATPPAARPGATGNAHTVAAGATTTVFTNTSFDGGVGSTGYTVGDLVAILKSYGMIQN